MMAEKEPFLGRWSRRKTQAREGDARATSGDDEQERDAVAHSRPESENRVPSLADIRLLRADSDFTVFMAPGVPADVRRAALRQLWRLCPDLTRPDGLVEYGEDFTDAAKGAGVVRTAYRVAEGMVRAEEEAVPATAAEDDGNRDTIEASERIDASDRGEENGDAIPAEPPAPRREDNG